MASARVTLASAYQKAQRRDAEDAMVMCAYKQGHGRAAYELGITAELSKNFNHALEYYQAGTRFGSKESAIALMFIFDTDDWSQRDKNDQTALKSLQILPDQLRKRRYDEISDALDLNPDLKLGRLDKVLPLPPAELPEWNGIQDALEPEQNPPTY